MIKPDESGSGIYNRRESERGDQPGRDAHGQQPQSGESIDDINDTGVKRIEYHEEDVSDVIEFDAPTFDPLDDRNVTRRARPPATRNWLEIDLNPHQ